MSRLHMAVLATVDPARGAAASDLWKASAVGAVAMLALVMLAIAHRNGRTQLLDRAGAAAQRIFPTANPASALASALVLGTLLPAGFGYYWDVATHIDTGRDPGPFANFAHYPILLGLAGTALAGFLLIIMGCPPRGPETVRIADGWHV